MKLFVYYIWRFFGRLRLPQGDSKALIKRLKQVKPVNPSPEFLKKSRAHLLSVLKVAEEKQERSVSIYLTFQRLIEVLSKASATVFFDERVKSLIRERVRHFAVLHELPDPSERASWLVNWANFLFGNRRAWALIVLAVFVAVVGIPFTLQNPDEALQMTYLRAEGKVIVERAGKEIFVVDEIILQEGDKVRTEGAKAEIFFLDDSVSRLATDTEVEITTLSLKSGSTFSTSVEMNVTKGRVWSNVVSPATDSSSFTVTASNVSGTVDKKATFDLSVAPNDVTVLAANNTVNLTVKQDGAFLQKVLAEGESLKLQGVSEASSLLSIVNEESSDLWIDENVFKDESYLVAVQDKYQSIIKEKAGVLPGSPFYGMKKFSESATVAFTFNEAEKEKKKLEIAQRRLLEAEALLSSGQMDEGKALLGEFQTAVEGMALEDMDTEVAEAMQNNLSEHIKGLEAESLDSLLSEVKSSLEEVAVLVVSDAVKKLNFKLDMSLDTLFAAREFLKRNATQAEIFEHFRAYRALAEEVVGGIQALSSSDRNEIIASLLEHKIEELMVLRILEGVEANDAFHKRISALKVNLLWDVNRILVSTGLETRWYQALRDQKNDEYTQKNLLRELKEMASDEAIVAALERFERYYLSNLVIELVKKDKVVTFEFAHLLLEDGEVTPNATVIPDRFTK